MPLPIEVYFDNELARQCIYHRDPNAVKTAGDLVAGSAELAPTVQPRQRDLDPGQLVLGVDVDGDAAAVIDHPATSVGEQGDVYAVTETGHRFVDRVVDNLPDEVVQPRGPRRPDEHARPLSDRLEALEHSHVPGRVPSVQSTHLLLLPPWSSSASTSCPGRPGRGFAAAVLDGYGVWPGCKSSSPTQLPGHHSTSSDPVPG